MKGSRTGAALVVLLLGSFLIFGAGIGAAAVKGDGPPPPPPPTRDHGKGAWYRDVCGQPGGLAAGCGSQVVSDADGIPLASATPPSGALGPTDFHKGYSLPTTAPGRPPTIAIVDAFDDPNIEADLAAYDSFYGLPPCTTANLCFKKVNQNGGTTYPSKTSWHLEIALDVETAHQICQNCTILLVEATDNSIVNLGLAVNRAVTMGATVVSNSYGAGEYSGETSDESAYFNHPGVVITASAGDGGYGVEFPAASQYVTAVGGTSLFLNADKSYSSESAWSGTGSGCSAYEPKPAWQHDSGCANNRTVADVSADADPNTGAAIYDSIGTTGGNAWYQVGGTSLAAPLVGAVYALTGNTSVNYGSAPYSHSASLNDVTSGSNGSCGSSYLCTAKTGFDGPTGLGTPNGVAGFQSGPATPDFSLGVSPSSRTVTPGASTTYGVTVTDFNGFTDPVTLSAIGLPNGATPAFDTNPATSSSTLTVTTTGAVAAGNYPFTISGSSSSGTLNHSISATLVVQVPNFSLGVTPSSRTINAGNGTTYTVTVTASGGFAGSVSLSTSTLPTGVSAAFSSNPATTTSTLTVTSLNTVTPGSYPITISGTSGLLTTATSVTLVVQPQVPPPSITVSTSSAHRGSNVTVSWSNVPNASKTDWIGIFTPSAPNTGYLSFIYTSSCNKRPGNTVRSSGSCAFKLPNAPGTYEFRLFAGNNTPLATSSPVTAT